jgi:ADP-ribosylglycohydrolase
MDTAKRNLYIFFLFERALLQTIFHIHNYIEIEARSSKKVNKMLGAITGDIVGSRFEGMRDVDPDFMFFTTESRFTDDTVLTVAVAEALLLDAPYAGKLKEYARAYPDAGYGARFLDWAMSDSEEAYGSKGNGSAMRVSPVGWFFEELDEVLDNAAVSSAVTHNHPDGITGARAIAAAVYLARTGHSKVEIRNFISNRTGYRLDFDLEQAVMMGSTALAPNSVPQALTAFLYAEDFEDTLRKAVSVGGDTDTVGAMAGAVAEAFYGGVPDYVASEVFTRLDDGLALVVRRFQSHIGLK